MQMCKPTNAWITESTNYLHLQAEQLPGYVSESLRNTNIQIKILSYYWVNTIGGILVQIKYDPSQMKMTKQGFLTDFF